MEDLITMGKKYVMNTYGRLPHVLVKGSGTYVWDSEGRKFLDFVSGIAVNSLGHCPPVVTEAIKEQGDKLIHCSNLYWIEPQIKLAKILVEKSCCDKAFLKLFFATAARKPMKRLLNLPANGAMGALKLLLWKNPFTEGH